ncbi:MAG: hypothetical protein ABWZ88_19925 [Variovorax sp.]
MNHLLHSPKLLAAVTFALSVLTIPAAADESLALDVVTGAWVRPDGSYLILIKKVGADGALDAMYFNPNPLPFAKAQASRAGDRLHASFELRAGGYEGSTYELDYDRSTDRLIGTYYQALAKQKFNVLFVRK